MPVSLALLSSSGPHAAKEAPHISLPSVLALGSLLIELCSYGTCSC